MLRHSESKCVTVLIFFVGLIFGLQNIKTTGVIQVETDSSRWIRINGHPTTIRAVLKDVRYQLTDEFLTRAKDAHCNTIVIEPGFPGPGMSDGQVSWDFSGINDEIQLAAQYVLCYRPSSPEVEYSVL